MKPFKPQKLVIAYFLLALVSSQFLLAQHSADHLDSTSHSQQDNEKNESDICQFCVTAKNLEQDFIIHSELLFSTPSFKKVYLCSLKYSSRTTCSKPFQSQAPPAQFS
ncbi:MAG: hypothetical protein GKR92_03585 [Gammaproteobacteria bacterium]|nr:MAG: hypothetical protein GKR92_03585 [Gammaproteobacteria bacterium]